MNKRQTVVTILDFVWCTFKNIKCTLKNSHVFDESIFDSYMFKTEIETDCLRCKIPLVIRIDSINEQYVVEEVFS